MIRTSDSAGTQYGTSSATVRYRTVISCKTVLQYEFTTTVGYGTVLIRYSTRYCGCYEYGYVGIVGSRYSTVLVLYGDDSMQKDGGSKGGVPPCCDSMATNGGKAGPPSG